MAKQWKMKQDPEEEDTSSDEASDEEQDTNADNANGAEIRQESSSSTS